MRVDQDRTGPLVVRRSTSQERVMWMTPDRVLYVGLLGAPSVRSFGALSIYVGLDCPVSMSVGGGPWQTSQVAVAQPYSAHRVAYASRNIAIIQIEPESVDTAALPEMLRNGSGAVQADRFRAHALDCHQAILRSGQSAGLSTLDFDALVLGSQLARARWTPASPRSLERHPELKHRISMLRHRVLMHAFEEAGYPQPEATEMADVCFDAFIHARHQLTVFPEAEPMLQALRKHFLLGVITNGNADVQRVGLADYFHFALRAEDIGIAKPDARLFQEALQRGGVDASAAVHIGDHPGDDIAGAQQAGLRAVWFNPAGKVWEGDKLPDAQIRSLTELPPLLKSWQ